MLFWYLFPLELRLWACWMLISPFFSSSFTMQMSVLQLIKNVDFLVLQQEQRTATARDDFQRPASTWNVTCLLLCIQHIFLILTLRGGVRHPLHIFDIPCPNQVGLEWVCVFELNTIFWSGMNSYWNYNHSLSLSLSHLKGVAVGYHFVLPMDYNRCIGDRPHSSIDPTFCISLFSHQSFLLPVLHFVFSLADNSVITLWFKSSPFHVFFCSLFITILCDIGVIQSGFSWRDFRYPPSCFMRWNCSMLAAFKCSRLWMRSTNNKRWRHAWMLAESPEVVCLSIHTKAVFNIMTLVYRFCARPDGIIMLSEVTYPLIISLQHEQVVLVSPGNLKSFGGGCTIAK